MDQDNSRRAARDLDDDALDARAADDAPPTEAAPDEEARKEGAPEEAVPHGMPASDVTGDEADFASEHDDTTFAEDTPGVPGAVRGQDSPRGRGGDGGMDP